MTDETDIIASIAASLTWQPVIIYAKAFIIDVFVFYW